MIAHIHGIVDPNASDKKRFLLKAEHLMRYEFAKNYIQENYKNTLLVIYDIGCATGYGSEILKKTGNTVCSFDINPIYHSAVHIDLNKESIGHLIKLKHIPQPQIIICFEILEHLKNPNNLLRECYQLLSHDGLLLLSIPQIKYDSKNNTHHIQNYSYEQAKQLINKNSFLIIEEYGQPYSNIIVKYLKWFSRFLNNIAFVHKNIFRLLSLIFAYPVRIFYKNSYSIIFLCKKSMK